MFLTVKNTEENPPAFLEPMTFVSIELELSQQIPEVLRPDFKIIVKFISHRAAND